MGGVVTLAIGLPYTYSTGLNNSGDTGATTDRPVINGVVVGRNAGRGAPIYDFSPLVERPITFNNLFTHANFVGYSGTYGNGSTAGPGFS